MKNEIKKEFYIRLLLITIFGIAMGLLEAIVVVYLRMIPAVKEYYILPWAPHFPSELLFTEQIREASTIVMLVAFALLIGKKRWEKLAVFLWVFAIWDIFYYVSLYFLISWPSSLLEMDVVFLIPIQWYVPVLSAIAVMIGFLMSSFYIFKKKCKLS
jgi:hypothetical protein